MKNLILIRHAKSDSATQLADVERPINQRGIADVKLVATHFLNFIPDQFAMYCSTAKRARETAIIFSNKVEYSLESIIYDNNLYTFDENTLEDIIKSYSNDVDNVILFGHNMALTEFVNKFADIYVDNVPTSGLIWLQFQDDNWRELKKGKIKQSIFPKNLK